LEALAGFQKASQVDPKNTEAREAVVRLEKLLASARGGVVVKTEPGGATVRLGGRGEDESPANYEGLKLGVYPVVVEKKGYDPIKKEVKVSKDETTVLGPLRLLRSEGGLKIVSEPDGLIYKVLRVKSDVSSDKDFDPRSGKTPAVESDLVTGVYQVMVERSGWPNYRRNVTVQRDQKENVNEKFEQGSLVFESDPSGADVSHSGGASLGQTPCRINLPVGRYSMRISQSGYETAVVSVDCVANEQRTKNVSLKKLPAVKKVVTKEAQNEPHHYKATVDVPPGFVRINTGLRDLDHTLINTRVIAPDKTVVFGVYMLNVRGLPKNVDARKIPLPLMKGEKVVDREPSVRTVKVDSDIRYQQYSEQITVSGPNNSYTRYFHLKLSTGSLPGASATLWELQVANDNARKKYQKTYLKFKASLETGEF